MLAMTHAHTRSDALASALFWRAAAMEICMPAQIILRNIIGNNIGGSGEAEDNFSHNPFAVMRTHEHLRRRRCHTRPALVFIMNKLWRFVLKGAQIVSQRSDEGITRCE